MLRCYVLKYAVKYYSILPCLTWYSSIPKWKEYCNFAGLFCLFSLPYSFKDFVLLYVLSSINNCWLVYLIFQGKVCIVKKNNFVPIILASYGFNLYFCGLLYFLLEVTLKCIVVLSKGLWDQSQRDFERSFCSGLLSPSRVSLLIIGGNVVKIFCWRQIKAITCNPLFALWSSMKHWLYTLLWLS